MTVHSKDVVASARKLLHVVFTIDITGSMSSQLEAIKEMTACFCETARVGVQLHIYTFTEDRSGCYVTASDANLSPSALAAYARSMVLCKPPGFPNVNASGGDGPENVAAALALMMENFEPTDNVLCFVITDNVPHHNAHGVSSEARKEKQWLREHGFEDDVFKVLNKVVEEMNVTIVPILYGNIPTNNVWFQQAAVTTGGLILRPESSSAGILAEGLGIILTMLQTTAQNGSIDQAAVEAESRGLKAFSYANLDLDTFEPLTEDPALPGNVINNIEYKLKSTGISAAMLGLLETTCDRFTGKKSLKRVKGVNSAVLIESIKVYLMSMLQAVGRSDLVDPDALVAQATVLKDNLNEPFLGVLDKPTAIAHSEMVDKLLSLNSSTPILKLPAPTSVETIDPIDEEIGVVGHPVQCLVTLETALSVLADLDETPTSEKDLHPWMELILQLCMVRLVDIVFPAHPITGLPDFADAWSARINTLSRASVLSAASAAHLRNEIGDMDTFKCPITGAPHSSALILSHPNDPVLSRAYKSLTYLPSLYGVIQSYLVSGSLVVFPSLGAGVQASTLMHLLQPGKGFTWTHENGVKASKATWEVVRCVLASLRDSGPVPAFSVVKGLKEDGMLNPADSVAKIVVGCLGYVWRDGGDVEGTLKLVAKELAGNAVASFKKWVGGVEGVEKEEVQKRFIGDDAIAKMFVGEEDEGYDPLKALHPVEVFLGKSLDGKELIEKLVPLVKETRLFEEVLRLVRVLGMIMRVDVREGEPEKAFEMRVEEDGCSEEDVAKVVAEAAVLGSRTGWYENAAKAGALRAVWKRREDVDDAVVVAARKMVRDEFSGDLKVWTGVRYRYAKETLRTMVNDVDAWTGVEDVELKLMGMKVEVFGKTHKLQRMDAVEVVQMMDERLLGTVGVAMCIGTKWTSEPPWQLKRHATALIDRMWNHGVGWEVMAELKLAFKSRPMCMRVTPNRHGHTVDNPHPGVYGWTEEYERKRLAVSKEYEGILKSMKRMTEAYNRVSDMDLDDETSKKCFELFAKCQELQTMKRLTKEMKKILPDFYV